MNNDLNVIPSAVKQSIHKHSLGMRRLSTHTLWKSVSTVADVCCPAGQGPRRKSAPGGVTAPAQGLADQGRTTTD